MFLMLICIIILCCFMRNKTMMMMMMIAYPRRDGSGWVDLGAWFGAEVELTYLKDSSLSLSSFKHHLKTFLFSFY